jgi:hypothetical protein
MYYEINPFEEMEKITSTQSLEIEGRENFRRERV